MAGKSQNRGQPPTRREATCRFFLLTRLHETDRYRIREYLMDFLAIWLTRIYNVTVKLPKWLLFIISGSIASFAINLMHRPSKSTKKQEQKLREQPRQRDTAAIVTSTQSTPSSPAAKRTGAKQRKGKK